MSENQPDTITHHAMLVAWGQYSQSIGLIRAIEAVLLHQKKVEHSPQTKILKFFIAILAGLKHLQELSRSVAQEFPPQPYWAPHPDSQNCLRQ